MIALVTLAEERLARGRKQRVRRRRAAGRHRRRRPRSRRSCAAPAPCPIPATPGLYKRFVLDFRGGPAVVNFVDGAEVGALRPRRRRHPGPHDPHQELPADRAAAGARPARPVRRRRCATRSSASSPITTPISRATTRASERLQETQLDATPRVILVPGLGLFGLGRSAKDAAVAADIAESWVATVTDAEAVGTFESLPEAELFEMEYWSLEQAKLGSAVEKPLAGQVALVTGGAGTIGARDRARLRRRRRRNRRCSTATEADAPSGGQEARRRSAVACDVTDPDAVRAAFDRVAARFGGVDIVVSNAGAAWQGRIGEVADAVLRESFELNFFAHQCVRAERGAHHAGARHRRLPAVQRSRSRR